MPACQDHAGLNAKLAELVKKNPKVESAWPAHTGARIYDAPLRRFFLRHFKQLLEKK